ncbi:hypothetical protein WICMUC_002458 [Wickerhamomyces mucosus]|uniref:21S rRNA pseudouridine(2819) synthase n=1 Tax=Wickerhamomyces mucosus TaxID=1378264 RepID=A0A9P8TDU7_9ASCO|nr:hypothetical protein WICMUC_002458 [Wickerhamomyces mucosus]
MLEMVYFVPRNHNVIITQNMTKVLSFVAQYVTTSHTKRHDYGRKWKHKAKALAQGDNHIINRSIPGSKVIAHSLNLERHPEKFTGIYQDSKYIIINKAPGHCTQDDDKRVGKRTFQKGIITLLREQDDEVRNVHRLDKAVSGGMLLAKDKTTAQKFSRNLRLGGNKGYKFIRRYVGLIPAGEFPPMGEGLCYEYYGSNNKGSIFIPDEEKGVCKTEFIKYNNIVHKGYQMIVIQLETGRKRQIRKHLSRAFNKPLMNDVLFGGTHKRGPVAAIGLHSSYIEARVGLTSKQFIIPVKYATELWEGFIDEDGNFDTEILNILMNFNEILV